MVPEQAYHAATSAKKVFEQTVSFSPKRGIYLLMGACDAPLREKVIPQGMLSIAA
jgi:hypothetical protein